MHVAEVHNPWTTCKARNRIGPAWRKKNQYLLLLPMLGTGPVPSIGTYNGLMKSLAYIMSKTNYLNIPHRTISQKKVQPFLKYFSSIYSTYYAFLKVYRTVQYLPRILDMGVLQGEVFGRLFYKRLSGYLIIQSIYTVALWY